MALARMRTAEKAYEIIKEQDPDTDITLYYIRHLIKSGKIPHTPVGIKKLVNVDYLIEYITTGVTEKNDDSEIGQIRKVEAR